MKKEGSKLKPTAVWDRSRTATGPLDWCDLGKNAPVVESHDQGQIMDYKKLVYKQCLTALGMKGGSTSDLAKQLKENYYLRSFFVFHAAGHCSKYAMPP